MHHKWLMGSTALVGAGILVASASPAKAQLEVSLGGYTEFGVGAASNETLQDGVGDRGYDFFMDNEIVPTVEGTSDSGVSYGSKIELEAGSGFAGDDAFIDEALVFFSGAFGRFEFGREDGAEDIMFVGGEDAQSGTGGIDGDIWNLVPFAIQDTSDAAKVTYYSPRIAGFQLGASFTPDTGDDGGIDVISPAPGILDDDVGPTYGFGANWEADFDGFDLVLSGVGHIGEAEDPDEDDLADYSVGGRVGLGGLQFGAAYVMRTDRNESSSINVGLKYQFGPASASVGWVYFDPDDGAFGFDDEAQLFAVSADYAIFPGVAIKGDVTYADEDPEAQAAVDEEESLGGVLTVQLSY